MSARRPPRLTLWLLRRCVPADVRDTVSGDLEEVFQQRAREHGPFRARMWFRFQAASFSVRFLVERVREAIGLGAGGLTPSWLDLKLGGRMLVKSPLLTITGCIAIATAIGVNAGFNEFTGDLFAGQARGEANGDVVRLSNFDTESGARDPRVLEDLGRWRAELQTVREIGAALSLDMGLVAPSGRPFPVNVAEMSASGFRIADMVPELGRPLLDSDDGPGAEPVMVLSHEAWLRYLGGNPEVVGSQLRLGETSYRVVGIAPTEFDFPAASFEVWTNFRRNPEAYPPRAGPGVIAFGRLADGRTLEEAQREMEQLGQRAAADAPETHGQLRPTVTPFSESGLDSPQIRWALRIARTLLVMLLVVACANVATLVFARNAGRATEIAIRHALGAGRGRIVMQLFGEALVLALLSTAVGLAVADWGLRWGGEIFWEAQRIDPPVWWDPGISLSTALYSFALAFLGAGVVGILPALRATGKGAQDALRSASSGGVLAFGRLPTLVIVVQVAATVAFVPLVVAQTLRDVEDRFLAVSFPTEQYLSARLLVDSEVQLTSNAEDAAAGVEGRTVNIAGIADSYPLGPTLLARYRSMRDDVAERLRNEPGVRSVALTTRLPGILGQSIPAASLELDGQPPRGSGWYARTATVGLELFEAVGDSMADGRGFTVADYGPDQRVAIVNQAFVEEILEGRSAVGRLVRAFDADGDDARPWTEIVGVLPDDVAGPASTEAQIYYPLAGAGEYPVRLLVGVEGDPSAFAPRLRAIVADAEPGLILDEVLTLDALRRNELLQHLFQSGLLGFIALVTALLATAGVYALMSFIVSQRTREIGIRTALGAEPRRVVRGVFLRTFVQLGLGVAVGLFLVGAMGQRSEAGLTRTLWLAGGGVSAVLVTVGLIGCLIPVLRALRIPPTEALRADG
jgi:putative ABC transport system permease protein